MSVLKRDDLLAIQDVQFRDVPCPEWGEGITVRIRNLTATARGVFLQRSLAIREAAQKGTVASNVQEIDLEMLLVLFTAVDEQNKPLFESMDEVRIRSGAVIGRLAVVAQELSGLADAAAAAAVKT